MLIAAAAVVASIGACKNGGERGGKPLVVASIFPVYDLARRVGGDAIHVELLLEPGKGVHAYNPTPKDAKRVAGAKLAFIIGLELDDWTTKILEASGGGTKVVALGERVKTAKFDVKRVGGHEDDHDDHKADANKADDHEHDAKKADDHEHDDHEHDDHEHDDHKADAKKADDHEHDDHKADGHDESHDHKADDHDDHKAGGGAHGEHHHHPDANDPHVWLSVPRAIVMLEAMAEELGRALPDKAEVFKANAKTLRGELLALDKEIRDRSAAFKRHGIVTFHGSFAYFAQEYGLDIVAVIEPFPDKEPSAMYLKEVLGTIETQPVGALYTEPQLDPRPAQVLAKEAELPLLVLDPVGGLEGRDSYEALMRFNVGALEESLR